MSIPIIIIAFLGLVAVAEAIWILFLHEQLHQRQGYIKRITREMDSLSIEAKTARSHLRSKRDL